MNQMRFDRVRAWFRWAWWSLRDEFQLSAGRRNRTLPTAIARP